MIIVYFQILLDIVSLLQNIFMVLHNGRRRAYMSNKSIVAQICPRQVVSCNSVSKALFYQAHYATLTELLVQNRTGSKGLKVRSSGAVPDISNNQKLNH
jgi:hypothetical protein